MFFDVYAVDVSLKTRFAALNFQGSAATWLQTVQRKGRITDWATLCDLVMGKFDVDQYQVLLNQFEQFYQSGSVAEYMEVFGEFTDGIMLYNNNYDDTYLVIRFLAGRKDEIRRDCFAPPKVCGFGLCFGIEAGRGTCKNKNKGVQQRVHQNCLQASTRQEQ
jgi:hypothetical protein